MLVVLRDAGCQTRTSRSTTGVALWPISGQQPIYVYQISSLGTSTEVRQKKYQVPGATFWWSKRDRKRKVKAIWAGTVVEKGHKCSMAKEWSQTTKKKNTHTSYNTHKHTWTHCSSEAKQDTTAQPLDGTEPKSWAKLAVSPFRYIALINAKLKTTRAPASKVPCHLAVTTACGRTWEVYVS